MNNLYTQTYIWTSCNSWTKLETMLISKPCPCRYKETQGWWKRVTYDWAESESRSVVSDSLWPHVLYSLWNSPGQTTRVDSRSLFLGILSTQGLSPGLPHCRWILYQLSHQGSPMEDLAANTSLCFLFPSTESWSVLPSIHASLFTGWSPQGRKLWPA